MNYNPNFNNIILDKMNQNRLNILTKTKFQYNLSKYDSATNISNNNNISSNNNNFNNNNLNSITKDFPLNFFNGTKTSNKNLNNKDRRPINNSGKLYVPKLTEKFNKITKLTPKPIYLNLRNIRGIKGSLTSRDDREKNYNNVAISPNIRIFNNCCFGQVGEQESLRRNDIKNHVNYDENGKILSKNLSMAELKNNRFNKDSELLIDGGLKKPQKSSRHERTTQLECLNKELREINKTQQNDSRASKEKREKKEQKNETEDKINGNETDTLYKRLFSYSKFRREKIKSLRIVDDNESRRNLAGVNADKISRGRRNCRNLYGKFEGDLRSNDNGGGSDDAYNVNFSCPHLISGLNNNSNIEKHHNKFNRINSQLNLAANNIYLYNNLRKNEKLRSKVTIDSDKDNIEFNEMFNTPEEMHFKAVICLRKIKRKISEFC